MSRIPQNAHNENEISDFVTKFIKDFQVGRLLFKCNVGKEKGRKRTLFGNSSPKTSFTVSLTVQKQTGSVLRPFLSARTICGFMKSLTGDVRKDAFIIDDSPYVSSSPVNSICRLTLFYKLKY